MESTNRFALYVDILVRHILHGEHPTMVSLQFAVRLTAVAVCSLIFLLCVTFVSLPDTGSSNIQDAENNIAFDLPDLTAIVMTSSGQFQLETYKFINNDKILQERDSHISGSQGRSPPSSATSQLLWVSIGEPTLCKTRDTAYTSRLFHFTKTSFYTHDQMLTSDHIKQLAQTARNKYKVSVVLSTWFYPSFKCSLSLHDDAKSMSIEGKVTDFHDFPLRLDFNIPQNSLERTLFMSQLGESENTVDLQFECSIASNGKLTMTNTLKITSQKMEVLGLEEKLFGPSSTQKDSVYVTRNQMTSLASEICTTLRIVKNYQMSKTQFTETFVEGIIAQIGLRTFTHVPLQDAIRAISVYGSVIGAWRSLTGRDNSGFG